MSISPFSTDHDSLPIVDDDIHDFKDVHLFQHIPSSVAELQSFSFGNKGAEQTKKKTKLSKTVLSKGKKKKVESSARRSKRKNGISLVMASSSVSGLKKNNIMTLEASFTYQSPSSISNSSPSSIVNIPSQNEEAVSSFAPKFNPLEPILNSIHSDTSKLLVRNLTDVHRHNSKPKAKESELLVDDDLQLALALSASMQNSLSSDPSHPLLDTTPTLEIDYKTGLLKYPSAHPRRRTVVSRILSVEKAKECVFQEVTEFLFSDDNSSLKVSDTLRSMTPSSLPWKDLNLTFWKLSSDPTVPSLSSSSSSSSLLNLDSFPSELQSIRMSFVDNSPLLKLINEKLNSVCPDSDIHVVLKLKKEEIEVKLHSILESTLEWVDNLKFDTALDIPLT